MAAQDIVLQGKNSIKLTVSCNWWLLRGKATKGGVVVQGERWSRVEMESTVNNRNFIKLADALYAEDLNPSCFPYHDSI